jgi:hypothetical protein
LQSGGYGSKVSQRNIRVGYAIRGSELRCPRTSARLEEESLKFIDMHVSSPCRALGDVNEFMANYADEMIVLSRRPGNMSAAEADSYWPTDRRTMRSAKSHCICISMCSATIGASSNLHVAKT